MRKSRFAQIAVVSVFLVLIVAPGLIQAIFELRRGERPGVLDVFSHAPTTQNLHGYEHDLEASSLLISRVRPWVQYLQWTYLGDSGDKAVLGKQGWLFYGPSVRYATERRNGRPEDEGADPLAAICSFRDQLQAMGIRLLVVPVPNKESVYPEMLAGRAAAAGVVVCERTRRLLDGLRQRGIEHVTCSRRSTEPGKRRPGPDWQGSTWHRIVTGRPKERAWRRESSPNKVLAAGVVRRGDHAFSERPLAVRRLGDLVQMLQVPQIEQSLARESLTCRQVIQSSVGEPYRDAEQSQGAGPWRQLPARV